MTGDSYNLINELREKLAAAERERDEYRAAVQSTAATAEAALGRLIAAQVIVDAAYALTENVDTRFDAKVGAKLVSELVKAVKLHQRGLPS